MWPGRIALLALLGSISTAHADPDQVATRRRPSRVATAQVLGVAGAAGMLTSVAFGMYARSEFDAQLDHGNCVANRCNAEGYAMTHNAVALGNVATGLALGSAAVVAAAAIIYLTAPRDRVVVVPVAEPHAAGLSLAMRF